MKLLIYNREKIASHPFGEDLIRITGYGEFYFSKSLVNKLDLKTGGKISFANDEEKEKDWYLCKDEAGFVVHSTNNGGVRFANSRLSAGILNRVKIKPGATFLVLMNNPIRVEGREYYKLIPSAPLSENPRSFSKKRKNNNTNE